MYKLLSVLNGSYGLLVLISTLLLSACIGQGNKAPHSDIFLVNNTHLPLYIQVQQTGDVLLNKGEHYFIYSDTVQPYATERILRIQRQGAIAQGQSVLFNSRIQSDNIDVEINQKIVSLNADTTINDSTINHSAIDSSIMSFSTTVNNILLPLQNDESIHRAEILQANDLTAELAFKASKKGSYDDIYYSLTEPYQPPVLNTAANTLSVLTYNIWALPYIATTIKERLKLMPPYLAQYDVLLLQEAFSFEYENLIRTLQEQYGYTYTTQMLDNPQVNLFSGGVILLSRFPIVNEAQYFFPDCTGTDCLADKGINYMEIIKNGRAYHIFSAHTASFDNATARQNRLKQFQQMSDFAQSFNIPKNETVIYGGDFNVNKELFPDDYQQMLTTLNASEPQYKGYTAATFDPFINKHATAFGSGSERIEYLDYILVSNQYAAPHSVINSVRIPRSTDAALWRLWDLSDHFPVEAVIE